MNQKKFVILHSNDMHGDLLSEVSGKKGELIGGLALLSGYINQVRQEEENVLYLISGDMVQGSLIDAEYKGISTIEVMNYLAPDVVALGNHEFDYGLPHLLFLEKMANFPIVNANLYIKQYQKRLMKPYEIVKKAGFDILFTGIITEKIIDVLKMDKLIGSFISLEDAATEVEKITNAYKKDDIDLTILLTHIGFDSDKKLAKMLKPELGVDMILGGHSHTVLEKPAKVNNILIAQAGVGTNQIGRFDIIVDDDTNKIVDYKWQLIPINNKLAKADENLVKYINSFKKTVDLKYNTVISKLAQKLTHPQREIETSLGNLVADIFAQNAECDLMLVGAGSIRVKEMGPAVTLGDMRACFPYDDVLHRFSLTGKEIKKIMNHVMRNENRDGEGECYQVNSGVQAVHDDKKNQLTKFELNHQKVEDDKIYRIAMQGFHYANSQAYLDISNEDLIKNEHKIVSTSAQSVLEEYLRGHQNISAKLEDRLVYLD